MMNKITIPQVIDRFKAYHADNLAWGSLHIVLDDENIKDEHVDFCFHYATENNDTEGVALATILRQMSKTQRKKLGRIA